MKETAAYWIETLRLAPHPEGGYFAQFYRSKEWISSDCLPERFPGPRRMATSIYFLLERGSFSALHRIKSDELWHFYGGGPLLLVSFDRAGNLVERKLGPNPAQGHSLQLAVEAGCWFGAIAEGPEAFSLVGCTVSPGFEFEDFELASRLELLHLYPRHSEIIRKLTRLDTG